MPEVKSDNELREELGGECIEEGNGESWEENWKFGPVSQQFVK